jgi:hypothetical protein
MRVYGSVYATVYIGVYIGVYVRVYASVTPASHSLGLAEIASLVAPPIVHFETTVLVLVDEAGGDAVTDERDRRFRHAVSDVPRYHGAAVAARVHEDPHPRPAPLIRAELEQLRVAVEAVVDPQPAHAAGVTAT